METKVALLLNDVPQAVYGASRVPGISGTVVPPMDLGNGKRLVEFVQPDLSCELWEKATRGALTLLENDTVTQLVAIADLPWDAAAKAKWIDEVVRLARACRELFLTPGKDLVYRQKQAECDHYAIVIANEGTPDPADYPMLYGEGLALGRTLAEQYTAVNALYQAWLTIGVAIEGKEAAGKIAVENAESLEAAITAVLSIEWPAP